MKKVVLFVVLALTAMFVCSAVYAADAEAFFSYGKASAGDIGIVYSTPVSLDSTQPGWIFDFTGAGTLSVQKTAATLTGKFLGAKVWDFEYQDLGGSWNTIGYALNGGSATPVLSWSNTESGSDAVNFLNSPAQAMRIGYYFNFTGGTSSGTAGLAATAVPEPTGLLAMGSGLVGFVFAVRRRLA